MKSRYVAFIVRIRLDDTNPRVPGNSDVQGSLYQAGSPLIHPFDTFSGLVDLLCSAITELEQGKPDATPNTGQIRLEAEQILLD